MTCKPSGIGAVETDQLSGSGLERLFKVLYNPLHIGYLKSPYNPDADGISMIGMSGQDTR